MLSEKKVAIVLYKTLFRTIKKVVTFHLSEIRDEKDERAYRKYLTCKSFENIKNFITQRCINMDLLEVSQVVL